MDTSIALVRLEVDGHWSADDVGRCFTSLTDLYDIRLFLELLRDDQHDWERFSEAILRSSKVGLRWKYQLHAWYPSPWTSGFRSRAPLPIDEHQVSQLAHLLEPDERLQVRRFRYSSPGFTDLAGIGTVVGHLKDFVVRLIERRDTQRQRALNDERTALENDRIRMENARQFVALGRDLGYSETELRMLAFHIDSKQDTLIRLIDQQKIRTIFDHDGDKIDS